MMEDWVTLLTVIGGIIAIIVFLCGLIKFILEKKKKLEKYYTTIWKNSLLLKPEEVLGDRPFYKYYYERDEDKKIKEAIESKKNVLVIGCPLAGKTRAVYQAFNTLKKSYSVLIPKCVEINQEDFLFPVNLKFLRPKIVFIDDLHRFVEQQNFEKLFRDSMEKSGFIVATCRSEMEYKKAKNKMLGQGMDLETVFGENIVKLENISKNDGKKIAKEVEIPWDKVEFNGTVGSVFMRLSEMKKRFEECENIEKIILRGIRNLYICGIYKERQVFPLEWIKTITKKEGLEGRDFEWTGWLENLNDKEFITLEKDNVRAEEAYLEYVVKPASQISNPEIFKETQSVFSGSPDALFMLGNKAQDTGDISLEKASYMKIAIKAYEDVLKTYTLKHSKIDYAATQNNLGNAYRTLAEVEDKAGNCEKAVKAYDESLKVFTKEKFPEVYPVIESNRRRLLDFSGRG